MSICVNCKYCKVVKRPVAIRGWKDVKKYYCLSVSHKHPITGKSQECSLFNSEGECIRYIIKETFDYLSNIKTSKANGEFTELFVYHTDDTEITTRYQLNNTYSCNISNADGIRIVTTSDMMEIFK